MKKRFFFIIHLVFIFTFCNNTTKDKNNTIYTPTNVVKSEQINSTMGTDTTVSGFCKIFIGHINNRKSMLILVKDEGTIPYIQAYSYFLDENIPISFKGFVKINDKSNKTLLHVSDMATERSFGSIHDSLKHIVLRDNNNTLDLDGILSNHIYKGDVYNILTREYMPFEFTETQNNGLHLRHHICNNFDKDRNIVTNNFILPDNNVYISKSLTAEIIKNIAPSKDFDFKEERLCASIAPIYSNKNAEDFNLIRMLPIFIDKKTVSFFITTNTISNDTGKDVDENSYTITFDIEKNKKINIQDLFNENYEIELRKAIEQIVRKIPKYQNNSEEDIQYSINAYITANNFYVTSTGIGFTTSSEPYTEFPIFIKFENLQAILRK